MSKKWLKSNPSLVFEGVVMMLEILMVVRLFGLLFLFFRTCHRKCCETAFVLLEKRCSTAACCSNGVTRFSDYSDAMSSSRRWAFSARCSLFTSVEVSADLLDLRTERHCGRTLLNFLDLLFKLNGRL